MPPASPYILQAGAVIPAALITGIRSDLPGQITAQVTENIYDARFFYTDELRRMGADVRVSGHHAVVRGTDDLMGAPVRAHDVSAGVALVLCGMAATGQTLVEDVIEWFVRPRGQIGGLHSADARSDVDSRVLVALTPLLDERAIGRTLARMASEIVERSGGIEELVLVGIQRRGVELADRLKRLIDNAEGSTLPCGKLDITLYRDDLQTVGPRPVVGETVLPRLDSKTVVIVDDVLYTGRTVRAALDEFADFGRPRRVLLCVLIDRGGRELPIQADVVGTTVSTGPGDRVDVFVSEVDGRDAVELVREA
jgi:pyrimidine operon attenuation protein / uracil phosphoribosyltransferase